MRYRRNNLPAQPTPLIGRARELDTARQLLSRADVRLLTLLGPAGIGKTRLALALAESLLEEFDNRVFFVDLAPVTEPAGVMPTMARALGIQGTDAPSSFTHLYHALRDLPFLLVCDNFEQVVAAAPAVAELLGSCPWLKIIATSRAPLQLRWEHQFVVPPLEVPDPRRLPPRDALERVPAVSLFVERARAVLPDFALDLDNAHAIAAICARLEGLPLAIELAAARSTLLSPDAILTRLEQRLNLLADRSQDRPTRHRTLRDAIGWSRGLLTEAEQQLFRRLAVFVGGTTPEAAAWVAVPGTDSLELLASLVNHSLLQHQLSSDGEPRFRMLETIREYAMERLVDAGEVDRLEWSLADYCLDVARRAEVELRSPQQVRWLNRLHHEFDNIRAALTWCGNAAGDVARHRLGLELSAALGWYWHLRGDRREGRAWLERFALLTRADPDVAPTRARALSAAGWLAQFASDSVGARELQNESLAVGLALAEPTIIAITVARLAWSDWATGDFAGADERASESLALFRQIGDRWGIAFALSIKGMVARTRAQVEEATKLFSESHTTFRAIGDYWGTIHTLNSLGQLALYQGDLARATALWEEQLAGARKLGARSTIAHAQDLLASVARRRGDSAEAAARSSEALTIHQELGERQDQAWTLQDLGELALMQNDFPTARAHFRESLLVRHESSAKFGIVASLEAFARLAVAERQYRRAVRLTAATLALRAALGPSLATQHYSLGILVDNSASTNALLARTRRALGRAEYDAVWIEGWTMALDQAVASALDDEKEIELTSPIALEPAQPGVLTPREREVAGLVARGLTNRKIAAELVITEGTCHLHVIHILGKLGFHSRAQIAVWAAHNGLYRTSDE